jgi:hypothetical protein
MLGIYRVAAQLVASRVVLSSIELVIRTLLCVYFQHILTSWTNFMGTPNTMRMLYNTSLLTES